MTKIVADMSMSLDGFIAGPDDTPAQPFGSRNAEQLHNWLFSGRELHREGFLRPEGRNVQIVDAMYSSTGAFLCGRRLYDLVKGWNGSHPIRGLPVVVLTHAPPENVPSGNSSFTFCTQGLKKAVDTARAQAKGKDVMVHGANTTQQLLKEGLADELWLHIVPIILGEGRRLFERTANSIQLEVLETVETPQAIHLRYHVRR